MFSKPSIPSSEPQPLNVPLFISLIPSGSFTLASERQFSNAFLPIELTPLPSTTSFILSLPLNAPSHIVVSPFTVREDTGVSAS